jgi:hypothetical protein
VEAAIRNRIKSLLEEASQLNTNDPLVHVDHSRVLVLESKQLLFPFDSEFSRLHKKADKEFKETGVFPLCAIFGVLNLEFKSKEILTPLVLVPIAVRKNKLNAQFELDYQEEAAFVNPYLIQHFKVQFDIDVPEQLPLDELVSFFISKEIKGINENFTAIGNIHHHRFEVIRELEELLIQESTPSLAQLLGEEDHENKTILNLENNLLFPADPEQMDVFKLLNASNVVVQGPPGTGKSQVLTNVIAKLIKSNTSAIVVSEKRSALEILQKKLGQFDLNDLTFIVSSETIARDFISALRNSWNRLEQFAPSRSHFLPLSANYLSQLQYQLDVLNQPQLIGGVSYKLFSDIAKHLEWKDSIYNSDLPSLDHWLRVHENVKLVYELGIAVEVGGIAPGFLQNSQFKTADKTIRSILDELKKLNQVFHIESWSDLHTAMKKAAICHVFSATSFKKFENLLKPDTKEQKRFLKLRTKYLKEIALKAVLEHEINNWMVPPSASVTEFLLEELKEKSYIKKWQFKKRWKNYSVLPVSRAEELLKQWKKYLIHQEGIAHLEADLIDLGLSAIETDMAWIYQHIHQYDGSDWNTWMHIPESEKMLYAAQNEHLHRLHQQLKNMFRWKDATKIELYLNLLLQQFDIILNHLSELCQLDEQTLRNLSAYATFEAFENAVLKSNYVQFVSLYPQFNTFDPQDLVRKCEAITDEQAKEAQFFAQDILQQQHAGFSAYHKLLQTSSSKLNPEQKILKQRLKRGKAILVKEFSKTKSFTSLRFLYLSEAQDWIKLLKPVWLCNPSQVAHCFPLEHGLFDVAIFDEASQIPLANALGTVFRAHRILVAGDSQQMGPSNYFKSGNTEPVDLLHQAQYYWKSVSLKHHYRSEHPDLIRFSNRYFYGNELLAFPSYHQEKTPLNFHYCEEGVFDERTNIPEAMALAALLSQILDTNERIGIVAFSETQLKTIYNHVPLEKKPLLEQRIEKGDVFLKSLENVQGDECDRLLISFGYGRTAEGVFNLRFGPLNAKNGHKRLNVLLTRARKRIDFFASVRYADFKMSSNESAELLRKFFMQIENHEKQEETSIFPLGLNAEKTNNSLIIPHIYENIKEARELVTLVDVLKKRGWEIVLSK